MPKLRAFQEQRAPFPRRPFLELLTNLRGTWATDSRDHIYSMLGFAVETAAKGATFRADYLLSPYDTFVSFAVWHISYHQSLDILGYCSPITRPVKKSNTAPGQMLTTVGSVDMAHVGGGHVEEDYLPCWVPDWSHVFNIEIFPRREVPNDLSSKLLYKASGMDLHAFSLSQQDRPRVEGLTVLGVRLAELSSVNRNGLNWDTVSEQVEALWAPSILCQSVP